MTRETYLKITDPFRKNNKLLMGMLWTHRILTGTVYIAYPVLLLVLAWNRSSQFWNVFLTPAISFVLVSIFRDRLNRPRPYEVFHCEPIIKKDTKGHSFPSRHVFSIFVIAVSYWSVNPFIGAILCGMGVLLGVFRVIGGVHFPKDVLAGCLTGVLCGLVGCFWL